MYKSKILNNFYNALFATDEFDYETATQNDKTDMLCSCDTIQELNNYKFEDWLNQLIDDYVQEQEDLKEFAFGFEDVDIITKQDILNAIEQEPEFLEEMKSEFEYLKEVAKDILDFDDEDDFYDDDEED